MEFVEREIFVYGAELVIENGRLGVGPEGCHEDGCECVDSVDVLFCGFEPKVLKSVWC